MFPEDWYWLSDDGRLYSSAVQALVDADDDTYHLWLGTGNCATRWPVDDNDNQTDASLDEVLRPYGLTCSPISLAEIRSALKADIDTAAELERLKYITPGNGQAMTYQQKVTEAQAFKVASTPKASDYPILSSEMGITAETLDGVADIVLAAFAQWQQIGAMIESIRLGAKRDIDNAEDEAAARAIVDAIVWPSAQVQA